MASQLPSSNEHFLDTTEAHVRYIREHSKNPAEEINATIANIEGWQRLHQSSLTPEELKRSNEMLAAYRAEANTLTTQYAQMRSDQQLATRQALNNNALTGGSVSAETVGTPKEEVAEFRDDIKNHFEKMPLQTFQDFQQALFFVESASSLRLSNDVAQSLNLTPEEKEQLKSELPTVRAMLGSLLVQSLLNGGLKIQFRYGGVNITDAERNNPSQLNAIHVNSAINAAIERNPAFLETLKAGILYASDDFANFVQSKRDATGNIRAIDMHEANFFDYMERVNRTDKNPITQTILANRAEFKNMSFAQYAAGTAQVPALLAAVQQIESNPQLQERIQAGAQTLMTPSSQNTSAPLNPSTSAISSAPATWTPDRPVASIITGNDGSDELWDTSLRERGLLGGTLHQIAIGTKAGLSEITTSPAAVLVALGAIIFSIYKFGWGKGIMYSLGALTGYGMLKRGYYEMWGKKPPTEVITAEQKENHIRTIHKTNNQKEVNEIYSIQNEFSPANYLKLQGYVRNGQEGLDTIYKEKLKDEHKKNIISNDLNNIHSVLDTTIDAELADPSVTQWLPPGTTKEAILKALTFWDALAISRMTPEQVKDWKAAMLRQLAAQATNPEDKEIIQEVADRVEDDDGFPWTYILLGVWSAAVAIPVIIGWAKTKWIRTGIKWAWEWGKHLYEKWKEKISSQRNPTPTPTHDFDALKNSGLPEKNGSHNYLRQHNISEEIKKKPGEKTGDYRKRLEDLKNTIDADTHALNQLTPQDFKNIADKNTRKSIQNQINALKIQNTAMIASLQGQIAALDTFKNVRPFSSKVDRERANNINTQIEEAKRKIATLESQLTETNASKRKSIQDEIKKLQARIQTLNKDLDMESPSLSYKIGGVDIKISRADGLKIDALLKELQQHEGVDIYRPGASGNHVPNTENQRPAEIVKEIDEILQNATPFVDGTTIPTLSDLLKHKMNGNIPVNFGRIANWLL